MTLPSARPGQDVRLIPEMKRVGASPPLFESQEHPRWKIYSFSREFFGLPFRARERPVKAAEDLVQATCLRAPAEGTIRAGGAPSRRLRRALVRIPRPQRADRAGQSDPFWYVVLRYAGLVTPL